MHENPSGKDEISQGKEEDLPSRDYIKERYGALFASASGFIEAYNKMHFGVDVPAENAGARPFHLDDAALLQVVWSALDDIWRYKGYHIQRGKFI